MNTAEQKQLPLGAPRKNYVKKMFNNIAKRYDFLNHLLSFGIDVIWRKKSISKLNIETGSLILDLASGTGDLAFEAIRQKSCKIIGADIAFKMLKIGNQKRIRRTVQKDLFFINADGEQLPFRSQAFDGAMVAFGIRNMGDIPAALREVGRTLKPGKPFVILEFSLPVYPFFRGIYLFYFRHILPLLGRSISGDGGAYTYLPVSVHEFPEISKFRDFFSEAGFEKIEHWRLLTGVAVIYRGFKS